MFDFLKSLFTAQPMARWRADGHNNLGWWAVDVTGWSKRFNTEVERDAFISYANKVEDEATCEDR
jgi:hypothetical protein